MTDKKATTTKPRSARAHRRDRVILAVLSDTHGGFKLGLMNPEVTVYDETEDGQLIPYTPEPTASQRYLWELYTDNLKDLARIADGSPIVVVHNGDLTQGNKHPAALVSTRMADQPLIAAANLAPLLALPKLKALRITAGTESHGFGQGSSDILVTEMLKGRHPKADIGVAYHYLTRVGGLLNDFAHHGPYPGSREWLKGNVARLYLRDLMIREVLHGNDPSRLVWRAHYHQYIAVDDQVGRHTSTLVITPSYCMLGDYAHQAARSPDRITNGMVAVEIEGAAVRRMIPLTKTVDIRTREDL